MLRIALAWCLLTGLGHAHLVQQIYAEFRSDEMGWQFELLFDAGYARPEMRNDPLSPQPQRAWLAGLAPGQQQELRDGAGEFVREWLRLTVNGIEVDAEPDWPDWESEPPDFPVLLNGGAYFRMRWTGRWPAGLAVLRAGLPADAGPDLVVEVGEDRYVTIRPGEGAELTSGEAVGSGSVSASRPGWWHFLVVGFRHVLPAGFDHVLFILGVFLLGRRLRNLVTLSLCFTVAHTLTLGLVAGRVWSPDPRWVEPAIGLSIAAMGVEALRRSESVRVLPGQAALVFFFGLLHGLGFGSSLAGTIQSHQPWWLALVLANTGVEVAQVCVLALVWALTTGWWEGGGGAKARKLSALGLGVAGGLLAVLRAVS